MAELNEIGGFSDRIKKASDLEEKKVLAAKLLVYLDNELKRLLQQKEQPNEIDQQEYDQKEALRLSLFGSSEYELSDAPKKSWMRRNPGKAILIGLLVAAAIAVVVVCLVYTWPIIVSGAAASVIAVKAFGAIGLLFGFTKGAALAGAVIVMSSTAVLLLGIEVGLLKAWDMVRSSGKGKSSAPLAKYESVEQADPEIAKASTKKKSLGGSDLMIGNTIIGKSTSTPALLEREEKSDVESVKLSPASFIESLKVCVALSESELKLTSRKSITTLINEALDTKNNKLLSIAEERIASMSFNYGNMEKLAQIRENDGALISEILIKHAVPELLDEKGYLKTEVVAALGCKNQYDRADDEAKKVMATFMVNAYLSNVVVSLGLQKNDFTPIQKKLVTFDNLKKIVDAQTPEKAASMSPR